MRIFSLSIFLLSILVLSINSSADTFIVDDDAGSWADYTSIQDAVDNASVNDTIRIFSGNYLERISVYLPLNITGNGTDDTIIDGGEGGRIFHITADNMMIGKVNLTNGTYGIDLSHSDRFLVDTVICSDMNNYGIYLNNSNDGRIQNTSLYGCWKGIASFNSQGNVIDNVSAIANRHTGIDLSSSTWITLKSSEIIGTGGDYEENALYMSDSHNNTVTDCSFRQNGGSGIVIYQSYDVHISDCNLSENHDDGLMISQSDHNTVIDCNFSENDYYGVRIEGTSDNNLITGNHFYDNPGNSSQGYDENPGNYWDNGTAGNYWSDYTGSDSNGDGIGDTPYDIDGSMIYDDAEDRYPLVLETNEPPIGNISSISPNPVREGRNVTFAADAYDGDGSVVQFVWRSSIDGEFYNGTSDSISEDTLSVGNHTIYLKVRDDDGAWSDEVSETLDIFERNVSNMAPRAMIQGIDPNPVNVSHNVTFTGLGIDDDGTIVRYRWNSSINGEFYNGTSNTTVYDGLSVGNHTIRLWVLDDNDTWSEPDEGHLEVKEVIVQNSPPTAEIVGITPSGALEGDEVVFVGLGNDTDGEVVIYNWTSDVDGLLYLGNRSSFNTTGLSNGTHGIYFQVMDDAGVWSDISTSTISVNGLPRGRIVSIAPDPALIGETVSFDATGIDDSGIERYVWISNLAGILYNGSESHFDHSELSNGSHEISLGLLDTDDVWRIVDTESVFVNIRPEVSIDTSSIPDIVRTDLILQGTSRDPDGAIEFVEISIGNGPWINVTGTTNWSFQLLIDELSDGNHTIVSRSHDGHHYSEISEVTVVVDREISQREDRVESRIHSYLILLFMIVAVVIAIVLITEPGRYLAIFMVSPAYSKVRKDKAADQATRGSIIEYIGNNPGVHFTKMKKDLEMHNGSLAYHVSILEKQKFVRSVTDAYYRRFYPYGYDVPDVTLGDIEKIIVERIMESASITQQELAEHLGITQPSVAYHIRRLREKRVVMKKGIRGWQVRPGFESVLEEEENE